MNGRSKKQVYKASPKEAKMLRKRQTDVERLLWSHLRSKRMEGVKFRRQHPFGPYIIDFISLEAKLIIELDGGQHSTGSTLEKDKIRDQYCRDKGFKVLRFWNNEVIENKEGVLTVIRQAVLDAKSIWSNTDHTPSPTPPPEGAED